MEFKQIETFVTLAEYLHFGQAAERLRIAQPHVSRRIKQLEDELDVRLFHRNRRNVRLTEAGTVFLAEARNLLRDAQIARERARESAAGWRGRLTVSLVGSAMLGILPKILSDFRQGYPQVHLAFNELPTAAQIEALAKETVDIAFIHPPSHMPRNLEHILLDREPLVAVLPTTHPLAGERFIRLINLANDPWVMFPRDNATPIYDRIIATCNKAGFSPRIVQEAAPMQTRLGLVAAGFGVHLVHKAWEVIPHPGVVYVPVQPTAMISHGCYWRRSNPDPILKLFTAIVRSYRFPRTA